MDTNNMNKNRAAGLGVAAAVAAAAAAAGAYWFYGSEDAPKHRRQVRSFMFKARADVLDAVERAKDIDKEKYLKIVDRVIQRYSGVAGITAAEIAQMARDLKAAWGHMQTARDVAMPAKKASKRSSSRKSPAKRKRVARKKKE